VEIHRHPEFPERIAGEEGLDLLHTEPKSGSKFLPNS
jgi:hypothetical protein